MVSLAKEWNKVNTTQLTDANVNAKMVIQENKRGVVDKVDQEARVLIKQIISINNLAVMVMVNGLSNSSNGDLEVATEPVTTITADMEVMVDTEAMVVTTKDMETVTSNSNNNLVQVTKTLGVRQELLAVADKITSNHIERGTVRSIDNVALSLELVSEPTTRQRTRTHMHQLPSHCPVYQLHYSLSFYPTMTRCTIVTIFSIIFVLVNTLDFYLYHF